MLKLWRVGGINVTFGVRKVVNQADAARESEQWQRAADLYQEALDLEPALHSIWVQYGHMLMEAGEMNRAVNAYEQGVEHNPLSADAVYHLACARLKIEDYAGAVRDFDQAVELGLRAEQLTQAIDRRREAYRHIEALNLQSRLNKSGRYPNLPDGISLREMQDRLDSLHWHHSIDFGCGLVSKARASSLFVEATAEALFEGLSLYDRTVVDIGAWSGAYSFEAKFRGAGRVLATDSFAWIHPGFRGREAFDIGVKLTGLEIEAREIDVPDISPESIGRFDAVLFSGVFYHLLDAVHLTKQISECALDLLIFETVHDALDVSRPSMIFYPDDILNSDHSNWWGPNPQCIYEMMKEFGFKEIRYRDAPLMEHRRRGIYHAFRSTESIEKFSAEHLPDAWLSLSDAAARDLLFAPM